MTGNLPINPKLETPIFQQIVDEMERQILSGQLTEGDFLPSVREVALTNTINPNTVAKAYQVLQNMNLVESVRGKGLAVKAVKEKAALSRTTDIITEKLKDAVGAAKTLGVSLDDLVQMLRDIYGGKK